jgi:hypothetical protein
MPWSNFYSNGTAKDGGLMFKHKQIYKKLKSCFKSFEKNKK